MVALSAVKASVPAGAVPATVAVNVMLAPTNDGFGELPSVVCVGFCGSPNAARWLAWSVAYTVPFATITLCQCVLPPRAALHKGLPDKGSSAYAELPPMKNTMLL